MGRLYFAKAVSNRYTIVKNQLPLISEPCIYEFLAASQNLADRVKSLEQEVVSLKYKLAASTQSHSHFNATISYRGEVIAKLRDMISELDRSNVGRSRCDSNSCFKLAL
jgi:hypothetical protein